MHARPDAAGKRRKIAAHHLDIVHDQPGMITQALAGRGQFDAAAAALQQRDAEAGFQTLDAGACGCERKVGAHGAMGDAAAVRHRAEKLKVNQIETHGNLVNHLPSSWPKAHSTSSRLCRSRASVNVMRCSNLSCFSSPRSE